MDRRTQWPDPPDLSFSWLTQSERTKHVHGLHPYHGKFIPQLAEFLIKRSRFSGKDIVLDPFTGSGTTNVECMVRGISSIGIEVSEFGCLLARVRTAQYDTEVLKKEIQDFERKAKEVDYSAKIRPGQYLRTWYPERSQKELLHMVRVAEEGSYTYRDLLKIIISRIARSARLVPHYSLDSARHPVRSPYYCHSHKRVCFPTESALKFLHRYCTDSFRRITERPEMGKATQRQRQVSKQGQRIICADAREFRQPHESITGVITSPPYPGLIDYHEEHRYAYELLGLKWKPDLEIGSKQEGQGERARERYKRDMVKVFGNLHSMSKDSAIINIVVSDRFNLYPEILHDTGFKISRVLERIVTNRTALRRGTFTEKVYIASKE